MPRRSADTGTTIASLTLSSSTCTLTNWFGNSALPVLATRAFARTVPVVVTVENPYSGANPPARMPLVPNMQVEVTLTGAVLADAIVLPEAALHGESLYLVTQDNRLDLRSVVPAFRQDGLVVLREGASAGEQVVLDAIAPALPGMALVPVPADGGAQ